MKFRQVLILMVLSFVLAVSVGCSKEGEAEKAGKQVDKAMDSAKDKFKELTK